MLFHSLSAMSRQNYDEGTMCTMMKSKFYEVSFDFSMLCFFLISIVADCRFWDYFVKLQQVDCQLYLYWIQPHCEKSSLEWFIISLLRSLGSGHDVNYFFTELTFSWEPNNFAVTFKYLLFICLFIFPCQSNYNCKIIVYNSILTFF